MPHSSVRRLALAAAASLFALSAGALRAEQSDTGGNAGEWGTYGIQTQWIEPATKPGDDFDRYVSGKWNDTATIPDDKSRIGSFDALGDQSEERIKAILEELAARPQKPGSPQARVAASYAAFIDTDGIERRGMAPVRPWLDRIYAVNTPQQLVKLFAQPGYASPVGIGVNADAKQSDVYALYIVQDGLGLPDRDYYLDRTGRYDEARKKYVEHLAFLLGKAGYADPQGAARAVYALETDIARTMWDRTVRRNRDLTYNRLPVGELEQLAPQGLVRTFLDSLGAGAATQAIVMQMPPTAAELEAAKISAADAAQKIGGGLPATMALITERPLATWQAWLAARFLSDHAATLPKDIDDASFAFFGTVLRGQPVQRPRWKRGIAAVEGQIGELLGQAYAERWFPAANKAAMADLVGNLRKAMAANLHDLPWMGPETRKEAEAKLAAFTPKIGTPDTYKDYKGLTISATDPLANQMAALKWQTEDQLRRIGKPVDRSEWFILPQTVNAYYNPVFNEIVFPAAILQPPFFNLGADPAVNYGAIGAVIGHEMGHGFDDQGAKSDGAGNLRDWWTAEDKARFEALQAKLAAQFNTYCPFDDGKTCVNGQLTMGENIGDLGGLSLAYRAYRLSLGGREAPLIDGTTGDQRFFMAWAQVWRGKSREQLARQYLTTVPHAPPLYRVNGIVRNFDAWYKAFDVKPGDALYLPPERRVRIW